MKQANLTACALVACATLLGANNLRAQDLDRTLLDTNALPSPGVGHFAPTNWPQWRGPYRDGKVFGFVAPATWPQELKQQWKVTIGKGDSTPALVDGKLYAFSRQDADEVIRCLDAGTGKIIWEEKYPADYVVTGPPARHPGTRSSPVVADGKICTLGVGGILSCLDAVTGKVLWRKQSTDDYSGIAYKHDSSMSPIVVDGLCIVHVGGKEGGAIFAFDLATGAQKWKWEGDAPATSSPVVMAFGQGFFTTEQGKKKTITIQLVTITAKSVLALDQSDGHLLWKVPFEATQGNNTTPINGGQTVYYTGQGKGLLAMKIERQGDGFAPVQSWTNSQLGARFTTPILNVNDGLLYGYNGHFFCADAKTGATLWTDTTARGNSAALVDAGPVIIASTVSSGLVVFKPDGKQYTELAKYKVSDGEVWAHPVIAGKRIFVKDDESVTCWSLE